MSKQVSLYFIHAAGRIKVGISTDVEKRLEVLRCASGDTLTLLASINGSWHLERYIHKLLGAYRLQGEWFTDCDEVRSLMKTVVKDGPHAIGFVPPPPKEHVRVIDDTPHHIKISRLSELMWPGDALRQMSIFAEQPEDTCALWLSGAVAMPRLIRMAFANHVICWIFEQEQLSRLGGRAVASVEGKMSRVPDKVAREAAKMRRQGQSEEEIVAHFLNRYTWARIKAAIDARNERKNCPVGMRIFGLGLSLPKRKKVVPREVVVSQQERLQLCHTSITAELLGDPLPGQSMLDKRAPSLAPTSVRSDPLDGLIYGRIKAV